MDDVIQPDEPEYDYHDPEADEPAPGVRYVLGYGTDIWASLSHWGLFDTGYCAQASL
jgi:hypothetical protein